MDPAADAGPIEPFLATPGPSNVPEAVRRAMSGPVIHHRSGEFSGIFRDVCERAPALLGMAGDLAVLTCSGTGAMQAVIENLTRPGDHVLVASFGRFGQRWAEIATALDRRVSHLELEWGLRPDPAAIAEHAASHPDAVLLLTTHSETSTGAVSDAEAIAAAVHAVRPELMLGIDAISSGAALRFEFDAWGFDAVVSGSQKAWMLPPGLAFAGLSARAEAQMRELLSGTGPHPYYLDLARALDRQREAATTPWTPAHVLVQGLQAALDLIEAEGMVARDARHRRHGRATRAALAALGVEGFSPDHDSSGILTAFEVPDGLTADGIRGYLRDRAGITTAGGQARLKGRIVRIGHCGWFGDGHLLTTIAQLERALAAGGHRVEPGAGIAAAEAALHATTEVLA